jgi:EAL domain-containing protein (putative c-di-GMP-specific phosphodiesterase class I)/GGDEF domain-containing protein
MNPVYFKVNIPPVLLFLLFTSIICFFVSSIGNPTKDDISDNNDFEIDYRYAIADKNKNLEQILTTQSSFIPSRIKDVPWSFNQQAYWLNIKVRNNTDKAIDLVSHFDNPMLDELDIFQLDTNNTLIKHLRLGDHQQQLPLKQRFIPHYAFEAAANNESNFYVRIATTGISNTPIHIYQQANFHRLVQKTHLLWGIFIGVLVIIGLYNLVLYYAAKDSVYLTYNAYILSCLAVMGVTTGGGFYIFPVQIQMFLHHQIIAVNCLVVIFVLLFLIQFLKFNVNKQWHYKVAIVTISAAALLLIISLGMPEYITAKVFFIFLPCVFLVCFTLIFSKIKSGLIWEKLYIYSWFPLLVSGAVTPLLLTGVIEYSFMAHHVFMIGVLIEIVLMAMALANRMRYQKEQILFNATHELSSGLPNMSLLENNINGLLSAHEKFAVCFIDIENYHSLSPYLERGDLQKLESQVIEMITPTFNLDNRIKVISYAHDKTLKIAKAKEGGLACIIGSTDRESIEVILNKLQRLIFGKMQVSGLLVNLNTRVGVCFALECADKTLSASLLIHHAQLAIEQNKDSGKQIYFYEDLKDFSVKERLSIARDLQTAIRTGQLQLYHQPQIDLSNGQIYGSEVLLRWKHSIHGFIPPDLFVGIAEDTGLINELTQWVIDQALKHHQQLQVEKCNTHKISINISGKDISAPGFLTYVQDKMLECNIPRNCIIFELTESVMVSDHNSLRRLMNDLRQLGISISIDDYGTGYSSLTYISQLKFDELKIDKMFILDLDKSARNLTIVKTTIDMAKNLSLKVIGEGVESSPIEKKLKESGCDIGQGYYYSKPLPFDQYLTWLGQYNMKREVTFNVNPTHSR